MSLDVNYEGITDWRNVCLNEPNEKHTTPNDLTIAIGYAFMSVDMDGLKDEAAVDEFMWRARILHATDGARLIHRSGVPDDFTREELLRYIGISCNVSPMTHAKFLAKVRRLHVAEIQRAKQQRATGKPTTFEREKKADPLRSIVLRPLVPNFTCVEIGELDMYFSYTTLVAIRSKHGWLISENVWSKTTGSHINKYLPNHDRVKHNVWEQIVAVVLEEHGLMP